MEFMLFVIRYIPFWAIPIIFIFGPASYVYWLKDVRRVSLVFAAMSLFCLLCTTYWVWTGGPEKSVEHFQRIMGLL